MTQRSDKEWFYVGHYGQLGPLTFEQMSELAQDGVIASDTYVWCSGMTDWRQAREIRELQVTVTNSAYDMDPPPFSGGPNAVPTPTPAVSSPRASSFPMYDHLPESDKSRVVAGLLNLIPGIGRIYLGHLAIGVMQLMLTIFSCGFFYLWPLIDAFYILMGGVRVDGYGRRLRD